MSIAQLQWHLINKCSELLPKDLRLYRNTSDNALFQLSKEGEKTKDYCYFIIRGNVSYSFHLKGALNLTLDDVTSSIQEVINSYIERFRKDELVH